MQCSWIEPGILAASQVPVTAENMRTLHTQGVRAVLTLTERPITRFQQITPMLLADLGITAFHVPIRDQHPPTLGQAHEILQIIRQMTASQRPLLIHCQAGVGRTSTILHLYYLAQGLNLEQATATISATRPASTLLSPRQWAFLRQWILDNSPGPPP